MILSPPVSGPGLYDLDHETYHSDPCPEPSLNHTIAKLLDTKSPLHAYRAHPRLGGKGVIPTREMSIGSAVHTWAIGKGPEVVKVDFDSYRTKAAQEQRDVATTAGKTPLLTADYEQAQTMAPVMRAAMEDVLGAPITDVLRETAAIARDGAFWLRSMFDIVTPDLRLLIDGKTTANVEPDAYGAYINKYNATAVAFYFQVCDLLDPAGIGKRRFVFVAQERECPEAITYHELDHMAWDLADQKMKAARLKWAMCQSVNDWPSYPRGPHFVSPKPWELPDDIDVETEVA